MKKVYLASLMALGMVVGIPALSPAMEMAPVKIAHNHDLTKQNKETVMRFIKEVMNGRKFDLMKEFFAPNVVDHDPIVGETKGLEAVMNGIKMNFVAMPDMKVEIVKMVAEGDTVMMYTRMTGTHTGEMMGMKPTGKKMDMYALEMVRFENGKMAEHWMQYDTLGISKLMGMLPEGEAHKH